MQKIQVQLILGLMKCYGILYVLFNYLDQNQ